MLRSLPLALLCVCASFTLWAQEPPTPGPQHKKLQELEGKWSFTLKAEGSESKGTCEYKSECGGLWVTSDFRTNFGDTKFQGKGLDGYDSAKKKYVSVWVDSMTTAPMIFEGDFDAKGEKMTMHATAAGPDAKMGVWRSVTTINERDTHTFEMFFKPQGGQEMQMMTILYKREGK